MIRKKKSSKCVFNLLSPCSVLYSVLISKSISMRAQIELDAEDILLCVKQAHALHYFLLTNKTL